MRGLWWNKKYPGWFEGSYEWVKGERVFVLTCDLPRYGKNKRKVYESYAKAKQDGWQKSA